MKKRDVVLRISLLGLVAVVLGTAAAMAGSEGGMGRMTAVEEGIAGEAPRALKLPGEMTEAEREIYEMVSLAKKDGSLLRDWESEAPYGCDRPRVYFMGNAHWVIIDDWVSLFWPYAEDALDVSDPFFWECWIWAYNADHIDIDTIPAPDTTATSFPFERIPVAGSILHGSDSDFELWWGLYRGESLLGYCTGNVDACGRGFYYVYDDEFTCEESLLVMLIDQRGFPEILFGYELFEDVPWDEYDVCEA